MPKQNSLKIHVILNILELPTDLFQIALVMGTSGVLQQEYFEFKTLIP